jgi:hypothetical protein
MKKKYLSVLLVLLFLASIFVATSFMKNEVASEVVVEERDPIPLEIVVDGDVKLVVTPVRGERSLDVYYLNFNTGIENSGQVAGDFYDRYELVDKWLVEQEAGGSGAVQVVEGEKQYRFGWDDVGGNTAVVKDFYDGLKALFAEDIY